MSDKRYIYGDNNGACYDSAGSDEPTTSQTFWDSRVEVSGVAHTVQVGVVPASGKSTDDGGIWDPADGKFLSLSRDGLNRLIEALQEAGAAIYGRDRW